MKNIYKKNKKIDPLADVEKDKNFEKYYKDASFKTRLAIEVYSMRKGQKISQQELAKRAGTTQKIISEIERGDYNIGSCLQNRIMECLNFNSININQLYNCGMPIMPITIGIENKLSSYKPTGYKIKKGQKTLIYNL